MLTQTTMRRHLTRSEWPSSKSLQTINAGECGEKGTPLQHWWECKFVQLLCRTVLHMCMLSHVGFFVTPWTVGRQVSLSMGFPRHKYWNGLPFPSPGDLPDPGIKAASPALTADSLPLNHLGRTSKVLDRS